MNHRYVYFDREFQRYADTDMEGNISIRSVEDGRELMRLPGFGAWLAEHHFSPDGRYLAASYHGEYYPCRLWDLQERRAVLRSPDRPYLRISPDSTKAVLHDDRGLHLRSLTDPESVIRVLKNDGGRPSDRATAVFHPNLPQLAVCDQTTKIHIFDFEQARHIDDIDFPTTVTGCTWHPHGQLLMAAGGNAAPYVFDVQTRRYTKLEAHRATLRQLEFHPSGRLLASAANDPLRIFWCPYSGRQLMRVEAFQQFSGDGRQVALARSDPETGRYMIEVCRLDLPRELCHAAVPRASTAPVWDVAVHPSDRFLAMACGDGVRLVDLATRREVLHLPCRFVSSVFVEDDLLIAVGYDGVFSWRLSISKDGLESSERVCLTTSTANDRSFSGFSSQRKLLTVPSADPDAVTLIDPTSGRSRRLHTEGYWPRTALSEDARLLATLGKYGEESNLRVWDLKNSRPPRDLPVRSGRIRMRFSPDDCYLATSTGDLVQIWDTTSWRQLHSVPRTRGGLAAAMTFSPAGGIFAVSQSPLIVKLIDAVSWRELATLEDPHAQDVISAIRFTHDGAKVVVAREAGSVEIWDLRLIRGKLAELGLDWQ